MSQLRTLQVVLPVATFEGLEAEAKKRDIPWSVLMALALEALRKEAEHEQLPDA